MKRWLMTVVAIVFICGCVTKTAVDSARGPVAQQKKSGLELYAFLSPMKDQLFLRITNRDSTPQTVLTKQPSLGGSCMDGRRLPEIGISYCILVVGTPGRDSWKFIPSLPDLAPVTLLKDETATMTIPIERELADALNKPGAVFSIDYVICEDIASRFGLWHGKLSLREPVASLLHK